MNVFPDIDPNISKPWLCIPKDWRRPASNEAFRILWDSGRSFGQIWPRPSEIEVAKYYEIHYYTHGDDSAGGAGDLSIAQRLQTKFAWLLDRSIEPDVNWWASVLGKKPKRVLEIGCGNGSNLSLFASLGHEVVGIEPDPLAIEAARRAGHEIHEGTAENLPEDILCLEFDAVIFMHVLEHCIDPFHAVRNAVRILKEGGKLVSEVPNNDCLGVEHFDVSWFWLDVPRHLNFFTKDSLETLCSAAGLHVEQVVFRGYCRQFSPSWKDAQKNISDIFTETNQKKHGKTSYWKYLLKTGLAGDSKKYDSVRVVAEKQ